jgi:ribosomal peptide maturation radical SAM protein 1
MNSVASPQLYNGQAVKVALVNMPFAPADRPSIQCGLLKAGLQEHGWSVDVHHLNLHLAVEIGAPLYQLLSSMRTGHLLGDWLFSAAAFKSHSTIEDYYRTCPDLAETCQILGLDLKDLGDLQAVAFPALIKIWAQRWDWKAYQVIGFTSTFEQNVAALAMARAIKSSAPGSFVVMGGANFDGEMGCEFMRAFPWLDYAVIGEADLVFPELVARIARRASANDLCGVVGREGDRFFSNGLAPAIADLDSLPDPDYSDYFSALATLGRDNVLGEISVQLPVEGSRGCWWGQKHPCRFCGLNSTRRGFRVKSAQRTASEIERLIKRYQHREVEFVDTIVDPRHLNCEQFRSNISLPISIFCNVPARLSAEDLGFLRDTGVYSIQPGIESLSSRLLKLMNKGTTLLTNLRILKWARHFGLDVRWNLLTCVPGEALGDYLAQVKLLPLISHLPPPQRCGPIWLSRFSPYFEKGLEQNDRMQPHAAYGHIYPENSADLRQIAYFWEWDRKDVLPDIELKPLMAAVCAWQRAWEQPGLPSLTYIREGSILTVSDARSLNRPQNLQLPLMEAKALLACDKEPQTLLTVASACGVPASREKGLVRNALTNLLQLGLVIHEGGRFLSLVLPSDT